MALDQVWPETLPDTFLQSGYTEGNIDNLLETSMDSGPTKRRKKTTKAYKPISGSMLLTLTQKAIFEGFFTDDIAFGALPFTMPYYGGEIDVYLDNHSFAPKSGTRYWTLALSIRTLI